MSRSKLPTMPDSLFQAYRRALNVELMAGTSLAAIGLMKFIDPEIELRGRVFCRQMLNRMPTEV